MANLEIGAKLDSDDNTSDGGDDSDSGSNKPQGEKVMLKADLKKTKNGKNLNYQVFYNYMGAVKPNTKYVFSFEYYADKGLGANVIVKTSSNADIVKPRALDFNGRKKMTVEFTTKANQTNVVLGFITDSYSTSSGSVYMWDFKLVEEGTTINLATNENYYGEWSDYNFKNKTSDQSLDGKGVYSFAPFNQKMVDLEYGITLDGKKTEIIRDESKKVMLKQENYKVREWNGENKQLKFQNFNFYFNSGNGKTKPSTTYVLSFEYYSDPGPFDMGVNCSNVCVRALNNADMLVKKDGKRGTIWIQEQGRYKFEYEFTTAANQDAFYFALMTGNDGVAYFWDFKIVEKGGDGTNLIEHDNFYGEWQDYLDIGYFRPAYVLSDTSLDGLGAYSFVPFNHEIANLQYGDILGGDEDDEDEEEEEEEEEEIEDEEDDDFYYDFELDFDLDDEEDDEEDDDSDSTTTDDTTSNTDTKVDNASNGKFPVVIIVIIGAAVLVAAAGATGFILYKKKRK